MDKTTEIIQESAESSVNEVQAEVSGFMQYLQDHIPDMVSFGIRVAVALLIFIIGRFIIQLIRKSVKHSIERSSVDTGVAQFTDSLLKFGMYVLLIMIVAGNLGIEVSSITALFAAAGVGISLALQGTLSNLAGGVQILFLKPFVVGDYIIEDTNKNEGTVKEIKVFYGTLSNLAGGVQILFLKPFVVGDYIIEDTNKNEGTVKEIKVFYTKLSTLDNKTIVIPNGILTGNSLTNVTAKAERQLDLKVGISYQSDLKKAKETLEKLIQENPNIIKEEEWKI